MSNWNRDRNLLDEALMASARLHTLAEKGSPMTSNDGRYTEGVCADGAAILRDGHPMRISEVLDTLNAIERGKAEQDKAVASAVAAERERSEKLLQDALTWKGMYLSAAGERDRILARLENPDKNLIKAARNGMGFTELTIRGQLRAVFLALTNPKGTST